VNDTPRRVVIGQLPPAGGDVVYVGEEDPIAAAVRQASDELDRRREEAKRIARATIRVDRAWLLSVLRDLISRVEADEKLGPP
jgi:hypothetical protein